MLIIYGTPKPQVVRNAVSLWEEKMTMSLVKKRKRREKRRSKLELFDRLNLLKKKYFSVKCFIIDQYLISVIII